jgi:hypothetical protein
MWHGWLEQGNHVVRMVGARQLFGWGSWSKEIICLGWLEQGNSVAGVVATRKPCR